MIKKAIMEVLNKKNLSEGTMFKVMTEIMGGEVDPIIISSFLTALRMKGETADEIAGAAKVMREKALKVDLDEYNTIDTCGTGGDKSGTYNISTSVAFVLAAAGVKVVKHGNRSISSKCGSADVLEALNININLTPEQVRQSVIDNNIGFLFAPNFHQAMKYAMPVRKALGMQTIFNILGPLSNPASAKTQLLGVFDASLTSVLAKALQRLGLKRALVVHGMDGLDEITITDQTQITELRNGILRTYMIQPEDFGLKRAELSDIQGEDAATNADIITQILQGEKGAKRDILLMNSGAALYISGKTHSIKEGIELATTLLDEGKVYDKLINLVKYYEVSK